MASTIKEWLGFSTGEVVAGLSVSSTHISLVALRAKPLRLTAVGRQVVFDAAVVDDEVRLTRALAADIEDLAARMRLPEDTSVVAAIEPSAALSAVGDEIGAVCNVRGQVYDRLVNAVHRSGLRLLRVDPVPAALARLARLTDPSVVAVRGAFRWSVVTAPGYTEAERCLDTDGPRLCVGPDLHSVEPLEPSALPIRIPRRLVPALDIDRDAVAIGAALAGFDLLPLIDVQAVAESAGSNWAVRSVTGVPRTSDRRQPPPQHRSGQPARPMSPTRERAHQR